MTSATFEGMELARQAFSRADAADERARESAARQERHEATDSLTHDRLDGDIKDCRIHIAGLQRDFKHATWSVIVGMATLIGTVIAKGHLF